jgi:GT2 family glycosyltransferase
MRPLHASSPMEPVCAVVVNWNGWRDTVVCLESLHALEGPRVRVVVCDNASSDDSVAELERYLRERPAPPSGAVLSVHLLKLAQNLGYAGGINAGIEWARRQWAPRGFWLLNNDVEAQAEALEAMVIAHASVPNAGICGSVLLEWEQPQRIQAVAGMFRRWLGVGWHAKDLPAGAGEVRLTVDYPVGASMYVGAEYLDKVGPMDPSYFLYGEEMDWAERGRRLGYRPLIALRSRLRHKEGASTGSRGGVRNKSLLSERYGVINRLRITGKFWPQYLPLVWSSLFLVVLDRVVHGETARAALVLRLMFSPSLWLLRAGNPSLTSRPAREETGP